MTGSGRKAEFCRAGDILIDDSAANIASWEAAGGIGILHSGAAQTIAALRALGLTGRGAVTPELAAEVSRRRTGKQFRRSGYTGYVLAPASQSALARAFGVRAGVTPEPYRLVCQHITRQFPAGLDTVDDAHPHVEVIGEFFGQATGHHVLAVSVDGAVRRPGGGFFHITYALDDSPDAVEARTAAGGKRPSAGESNSLLNAAVEAAAGSEAVLSNLPPDRRLRVDVDFARLDRARLAALPKARAPVSETVDSAPHVFARGVPDGAGGALTQGVKTVRRRGDSETTTYDVLLPGGGRKKHSEDGPAIERRNTRTGKVEFQAWYLDGQPIPAPLPDVAARQCMGSRAG